MSVDHWQDSRSHRPRADAPVLASPARLPGRGPAGGRQLRVRRRPWPVGTRRLALAAGGLLLWVWRISWPRDSEGTKRLAEEEGRTRVTDTVVLSAAVVSLGAGAEALVRSSSNDLVGVVTVVLGVAVVIVSWALVNSVFAFKYARLYYCGGDGGIEFQQGRPPAYSDFAYIAFTVGMSFSVPEVRVVDRQIGRSPWVTR